MMTLEELLALGRAKLGAQAAYNRVQLLASERARLRALRSNDARALRSISSEAAIVAQLWHAYQIIAEIDQRNPGDPAATEALEEVRTYLAGVALDPAKAPE